MTASTFNIHLKALPGRGGNVQVWPTKYFVRVAEESLITRGASMLGIAQPALSRQVQPLEEDLGVTHFRRTRRGLELTEEGSMDQLVEAMLKGAVDVAMINPVPDDRVFYRDLLVEHESADRWATTSAFGLRWFGVTRRVG